MAVRIMGSLHMTIQTAVLIETLVDLGADVRWCSCNIFSTQDHAAAAIAATGVPVFAWKGESLEEYWWCTERRSPGDGQGPELIVDDGGDATLLIHKGYQLENGTVVRRFERRIPRKESSKTLLKSLHDKQPTTWHGLVADWQGVSEETTTGVHRLYQMVEAASCCSRHQRERLGDQVEVRQPLRLPRIAGRWHQACHRRHDRRQSRRGLRLRRCRQGLRPGPQGQGAQVVVTEIDPICALQAAMEGFRVMPVEDTLGIGDIYVTTTGNKDIITLEHMRG